MDAAEDAACVGHPPGGLLRGLGDFILSGGSLIGAGARWVCLIALCGALVGARAQMGSAWPEADKLFHSDPRWLGSDAAFSIDLGQGKVLWLFGDTFVARHPGDTRIHSAFLRNTVGIQTGYDPSKASMKFYWRTGDNGPLEIFPSSKEGWLWPQSGVKLGNTLLIFCSRIEPDLAKNSLGFKASGWVAFRVENPDGEPSSWKLKKVAEDKGPVTLASAVLRDGEFLDLLGSGDTGVYLARVSADAAQRGDLHDMKWWAGGEWRSAAHRQILIFNASTEASLQVDPRGSGFLEVNSQGFGASDIVMRRAPRPEGPWSEPEVVYRPPESDEPYPFVYAGKAHPELKGAEMIVTYAANGPDQRLAVDMGIYFPRFVRVKLPPLVQGTKGLLVREK